MYQDFNEFEKFYQSELGINVKYFISLKLKKYIYLYDSETLGSFGFGNPYLNLFSEKNIKIFNFLSKKVGIKKNSYSEKITDVLLDEEKLPIEDLFFNHIVSVHYLENASNLKKNLRELWRVLAPEGKIYIVLPNKKSSWNILSSSPFSSGFGFSKNKITQILEDNFFETQFIDRLVYFPPWNSSMIIKNKFLFEKMGSYFWRFFNGVYLCVAKKRIYATPHLKSASFAHQTKIIKKID